jgi:hypothetical protein
MIYDPATQGCCFSQCKKFPGPSKEKDVLENILHANAIDIVTCKQWLTTDRPVLESIIKST